MTSRTPATLIERASIRTMTENDITLKFSFEKTSNNLSNLHISKHNLEWNYGEKPRKTAKNRESSDNFSVACRCGNSSGKQSISIKITDRKIMENLLGFHSVDQNLKVLSWNLSSPAKFNAHSQIRATDKYCRVHYRYHNPKRIIVIFPLNVFQIPQLKELQLFWIFWGL